MAAAQGPAERRPGAMAITPTEKERRRHVEALVAAQKRSGVVTRIFSKEEFARRSRASGVVYEARSSKGRMAPDAPEHLREYYRLARGREAKALALAAIAKWHLANDRPR